jgi:hypothetical protein
VLSATIASSSSALARRQRTQATSQVARWNTANAEVYAIANMYANMIFGIRHEFVSRRA